VFVWRIYRGSILPWLSNCFATTFELYISWHKRQGFLAILPRILE
jgi:hypothetical protein